MVLAASRKFFCSALSLPNRWDERMDAGRECPKRNPKHQIANSKKIPSTKSQEDNEARTGAVILEFGICLGFGIWCLGFCSLLSIPSWISRRISGTDYD